MTVRGRATRARLIEATVSVVREVGYAHASTRAIAEAAGVSEGTIYRHFTDKASLFFAALLESNAPVVAWVTTLPARAGESTVEQNLTDAAVQLVGLRDQILPLELAMAAAGTSLPPGPPAAVAAYLAAEQRLGRIRADVDPMEAASVFLGMLFALGTMPAIGVENPSPVRVASAVRMLIRGIEPRPSG
jgi:AcrR family transcriptional regulator